MKHNHPVGFLSHWFFILPYYTGDWNYIHPELWPSQYPQCGGRQQSPIALITENSYPNELMELNFYHYTKNLLPPVEVINNGYSAEVGVRITEDNSPPAISVGDSPERYEVQTVHFHWGSERIPGSEHTIDGRKFDLEMHMVHKNSKYETIEIARENPDGFIVLSVLFNAARKQKRSHPTLSVVYDALERIREYNSTTELNAPITMKSFLPKLESYQFFSYRGSLTTPPCSESVLWFVSSDVTTIPIEDLEKFWTLSGHKGHPILNNFRPIQKTHRKVFQNLVKFDYK